MNRAGGLGQQLDLFEEQAGGQIPISAVLLVCTATKCGCTHGYTRSVGRHVGLYCSGHGIWIKWLDAAARERADREMRAGGDV